MPLKSTIWRSGPYCWHQHLVAPGCRPFFWAKALLKVLKRHFKEHYLEIRSLLRAPAPGCTWLRASAQLALVDDGTSCRHQVDQVPPPRRPTKTGPAAAGHHLHQQLIHQPSLAANGPRQKCHGGATSLVAGFRVMRAGSRERVGWMGICWRW